MHRCASGHLQLGQGAFPAGDHRGREGFLQGEGLAGEHPVQHRRAVDAHLAATLAPESGKFEGVLVGGPAQQGRDRPRPAHLKLEAIPRGAEGGSRGHDLRRVRSPQRLLEWTEGLEQPVKGL